MTLNPYDGRSSFAVAAVPLPHSIPGSVERVSCGYCQPIQCRDGEPQIENDVQIEPVFTHLDIGYVVCPFRVCPSKNTLIQQVEHVITASCHFIFLGLNSLEEAVTSQFLSIGMHGNLLRGALMVVGFFAKLLFFLNVLVLFGHICVSIFWISLFSLDRPTPKPDEA